MKNRNLVQRTIALAALVICTTSGMAMLPSAQATAPLPTEDTTEIAVGMNVGGFDAAVAAQNGYAIVTAPDGIQYSVPQADLQLAGDPAAVQVTDTGGAVHSVSDDVLAAASSYDPANPGVASRGYAEVAGDCGWSWIRLGRNGGTSVVSISTGYNVRAAVQQRVWTVNLYGVYGVVVVPLNGGVTAPSWSGVRTRTYSAGGFGNVVPGSHVILVDGATCWSGNPGTTF